MTDKPDDAQEIGHIDLGQFVDWVWRLQAERDELKFEIESLRKDAERYRWLRAQDDFEVVLNCGAELDKVVDRKMVATDER
jgi:hypothetical protein